MVNNKIFEIDNLAQTKDLALLLSKQLKSGSAVLLKGDLGAGKTTFAQFMIQAFCGEQVVVTSPTFNLVHTYEARDFTIWHFDLYRLKDPKEIHELGLEDALRYGVSIIEWPELIEDMLNIDDKITIQFSDFHSSNKRIVEVSCNKSLLERHE